MFLFLELLIYDQLFCLPRIIVLCKNIFHVDIYDHIISKQEHNNNANTHTKSFCF